MRRARTWLARGLLVAALAAVAALGLYVWYLPQWAETTVRARLRACGFADSALELRSATWRGLRLANVRLGAGEHLRIAAVDIDYDPWAVWRGDVRAVRLVGLDWHIDLRAGGIDAGLPDQATSGGGLAFERLEVVASAIDVRWDGGRLRVPLSGTARRTADGGLHVALVLDDVAGAPVVVDAVVDPGSRDSVSIVATLARNALDDVLAGRRVDAADLHVAANLRISDAQLIGVNVDARASRVVVDGRTARDVRLELARDAGTDDYRVALAMDAVVGGNDTHVSSAGRATVRVDRDGWHVASPHVHTALTARTVRAGAARLDRVRADAEVRVAADRRGVRVHLLRPARAAAAQLTIGERVSVTEPRLRIANAGTAPALVLDGRRARFDGDVRATAPAASAPHAQLDLADLDVSVPVSSRGASGPGTARVGAVTWRGQPIGALAGALATTPAGFAADLVGDLGRDGPISLRVVGTDARVELHASAPRLHITPRSTIGTALAAATGINARGYATVEADVALGDGRPRVSGRIAVERASLRSADGTERLLGISTAVDFASLSPLVTAPSQTLTWASGRYGGVRFGGGEASFAIAADRAVHIGGARVAVGGGHAWLTATRVDPAAPVVRTDVLVDGLNLAPWLEALSGGRMSGTGAMSGRVPVEVAVAPLRVELGEGELHAVGDGTFRVTDADAVTQTLAPDYNSLVETRIRGALRDFSFRTLSLRTAGRRGARVLTLHAVGRGRAVPQELDITFNVAGYQDLVDVALDTRASLARDGGQM